MLNKCGDSRRLLNVISTRCFNASLHYCAFVPRCPSRLSVIISIVKFFSFFFFYSTVLVVKLIFVQYVVVFYFEEINLYNLSPVP